MAFAGEQEMDERQPVETGLPSRVLDLAIAAAVGLLALMVYVVTLSASPYPGESADLIVRFAGIEPKYLPTHPLWAWVVAVLARIPLGGLAARLGLFSALCGAVAVGLLYSVVRGALQAILAPDPDVAPRAAVASRLAGVTAALALAFCVPFWMVSNRAHTGAFDVMLLLLTAQLAVHWLRREDRIVTAFVLALVTALVSTEFATAVLALPVVGLLIVFRFWRIGELRFRNVAILAAAFLLGLSVHFLSSALFLGSPGYELRGYEGYWQVLRQVLRYQRLLLMHSLPREGWLIILFTTAVPWIVMLVVGRRALTGEKDWSYLLLHLIMTVMAAGVLANMPIAPWPMMTRGGGAGGQLLVTPYVLAASLLGYVAAYWFLLPATWWPLAEDRVRLYLRKWTGLLLAAPFLCLVVVMPFRNGPAANGRQARFLQEYADAMLSSLGDRTWLLSDGLVDDVLLIRARDRGRDLELINVPATRTKLYARYVARRFDEVRLKNLIEIGVFPFLHEWLSSDPRAADLLAVESLPDVWVGEGYEPVPKGLVFVGAADRAEVDADALLAEHRQLWNRLLPVLRSAAPEAALLGRLRDELLRRLALLANNFGVLLEDLDRAEAAFEAYGRALDIDDGNLSALLNRAAMIDRGFAAEQAEAVRAALAARVQELNSKPRVWSLSRYYGYVRLPQAFAQQGWTWALSGRPGMAAAGMRRALELVPNEDRRAMQHSLARIYLSDRDVTAGGAVFEEMLAKDPDDIEALFGMARIRIMQGDHKAAVEYLKRAKDAGVSRKRMALEWGSLLAAAGQTDRARIVLEEVIGLDPAVDQAWAALVAVLVHEGDEAALAQCIDRMEKGEGGNAMTLAVARGHLAFLRRDLDAAREAFNRALRLSPNHVHALSMLLRLDAMQGREAPAERHVRALLSLDPDNALANHINGTLQLKQGNLLLAEDSFRRALQSERAPMVLNDLAWLLQMKGEYAEGEALAREALEKTPDSAEAWDTLGVTLTKAGRIEEAREALDRALALSQANPEVMLHMAQLHAEAGDRSALAELVEMLEGMTGSLTPQSLHEFEELKEMVE